MHVKTFVLMSLLLFLLMVLLHIIDDFVLQPVCLSKLKQKVYWENDELGKKRLYRNDYKAALFIHGLSWSITVHLPLMCMQFVYDYKLGAPCICISVLMHAVIHACIDDIKANLHAINLIQDQLLHFAQLVSIFMLWYGIVVL